MSAGLVPRRYGHPCTKGAIWPCKPDVVGSIPTVSTSGWKARLRAASDNGNTSGLHPEDRGSIPRRSTTPS